MDRNEKARQLMKEAEDFGIRFEYDAGLLLARLAPGAGPRERQPLLRELGKYIHEVRDLVMRRALAARAEALKGKPLWCATPETQSGGVLLGESNGHILISLEAAGSPQSQTADLEALIILLEAGKAGQ